jgi:hypothetical protein
LRSWNVERQYGLIVADDGESFYVDDRFLACEAVPPLGSEVWFRPRPALIEGKNRVAAMVMAVGGTLAVPADAAIERHKALVRDQAGNTGILVYAGGGESTERHRLRVETRRGQPIAT